MTLSLSPRLTEQILMKWIELIKQVESFIKCPHYRGSVGSQVSVVTPNNGHHIIRLAPQQRLAFLHQSTSQHLILRTGRAGCWIFSLKLILCAELILLTMTVRTREGRLNSEIIDWHLNSFYNLQPSISRNRGGEDFFLVTALLSISLYPIMKNIKVSTIWTSIAVNLHQSS